MKKFMVWMMGLMVPTLMCAHTLLLHVSDNDDDTISIKGEFSTGEGAPGALVKLQALGSQEILLQQRLPDSSELVLSIPKVPYEVILDGGPGHQISRKGIAPKAGFKKTATKNESASPTKAMSQSVPLALSVCLGLAFVLLGGTLFISIYNTNRLLKKLNSAKS
ncbi:hypothetical protein [Sulfurospirillum halorespirans]|uniref:Uncharacterized protein n=1 Tax=Sulfurospirillum halorespirans DSM 13726 TaxID=1193502 RepID=A0A1D7TKX0_9BACT|nr:hypothetical protein [Sulfurospirillum halorespirans]AOO65636.1 hypothetical protein SHALO_1865 [Sulfurospirillum halorespirans DSM 13726]